MSPSSTLQSASSAMKATRSGSRRVRTPNRIVALCRRGNPPRRQPVAARSAYALSYAGSAVAAWASATGDGAGRRTASVTTIAPAASAAPTRNARW